MGASHAPGSFQPVGLGEQQLVEGGHQAFTGEALDRAAEYARKSETHLWLAILSHSISEQALLNLASEPPIFDMETLLSSHIGCYICEQPYERRQLHRRCPGEPR